jgi:hypothetical protein
MSWHCALLHAPFGRLLATSSFLAPSPRASSQRAFSTSCALLFVPRYLMWWASFQLVLFGIGFISILLLSRDHSSRTSRSTLRRPSRRQMGKYCDLTGKFIDGPGTAVRKRAGDCDPDEPMPRPGFDPAPTAVRVHRCGYVSRRKMPRCQGGASLWNLTRNERVILLCDRCVRLLNYADARAWKWFHARN